MKNFTNLFKHKTSPLWIRLLIMTFMLLVGTSSAWAGKAYSNDYVYLYVGNFTSWKNDNAQFKVTLNTWDHTGGGSKYYVCMTAVPNMTNYYYAKITNGISALNNSVYGMWFYRCGSCSGSGTGGNDGWNDFFVSDTSGDSGEMKDGKNLARVSGWSSGALDTNFALTPSSVTLKVTSGATGGTGTQNDPYLVEVGTQFTLSASNLTFNPADPEMVGRYNFGTSTTSAPTGTSTTSTQTASSTANTTKQYYVSVRGYYNGVYSSSYKTASVYVKTVASCIDPQASDFTYTAPANLVYNGSAKAATVTWESGTGTGTITKYYKSGSGSYITTAPTAIGTYTVAVKTTAAGNYCATSDYVEVGSFTITCAQPVAANFNYTAPSNLVYNGSAKTATVTWKSGTGTGTITKYYKSGSGSYITTAPTAAGTYTVAVKTTAAGNYCATSDYVIVGSFTITCPAPSAPTVKVIEEEIITCNGNNSQLGRIQITNYNADYEYKIGLNNDPLPAASIEAGGYINISFAGTFTLYAINECGSETPATTSFTIKQTNNTPTISGETFTQPGKENAIELTVPAGIAAQWSVSPAADLSVSEGNSTMFSAENKDTYTITADYNGCTDTHDVTVSDAFYIWVRNAKESDTAYGQFYYPNENSEAVRGGAMFYAECDALPTTDNYTTYNRGGRKADIVNDDCDGYTWYGFKASADVIAGTKYFYVHATNDLSDGGYYTHSKPLKSALSGDVYYTLGTTGDSFRGWNLSTASAPYAGPRVYASGSTTLGANQFAALYVTDCSGKEIDTYQWQSSSTQNGAYNPYSASVTNSGTLYSGDAGKTNNIRPATDGWYRCKVTYTDGSSLTSEAKQVTGTFTRLTSTLPVIIVNTNGVGFPVNNFGGTPSKNADKMKEKVSVDVKIYDGNTMVYDRKARMNYRGSSSLNFLKKSYAFCPGKDNCVEDKGRLDYVKTEKMNMLGIGTAKDKDWVLYAAAADPSLMRNRLMFDTYRDMTGGWNVNSRYVELYVDGEYKGVYVMMDKVTKNEGRVNITDENGFIVKFDKTDLADRYEADGDKKTFKSLYSGYDGESGNGMKTYDTYIDQRFEIEYPEMEDVEEDNPGMWAKTVNDIKTLFNNFESNLKAGNYAEVQKIIDYTSWADWFIISEYAKNMDAYRASCLFVYDGGKIEARPLWDQELSFSNQCANLCATYGCNSTEGLLIENDKIYEEGCAAPFWFTGKYVGGRGTEAKDGAQFEGYLLNDPCFIAVLKERWALHTAAGGALTKEELKNKLDVYLAELDNQHQWGSTTIHSGTPLYREFYDFWGNNSYSNKSRTTIDCGTGSGCFDGTTGYQDLGFHNSKVTMYNWTQGANDRRTRLGTIINNMEGSPLSISFAPQQVTTTPWEPITLQVVNTSSYDYTITYTDGELDKQSGVIINKTDDTFKINVPRPDKWGIGDEKVVDERADITYGIKATLNVADGTTVCGNSEVTPATATIILQDEPNEDCPQ